MRGGLCEDGTGSGEAARWRGLGLWRRGLLLEGLDQDAFDAADIDQVDLKGAAAGIIEASGRVALRQAQQLVSLPQLCPGHRTVEQPLGVTAHGLTELGRASLDLLWGTERVGG